MIEPVRVQPPTLRSELTRGLAVSNLLIAALPVAGLIVLDAAGVLAAGPWIWASLWLTIVALHAVLHAYYGWRYGRGLLRLNQGRQLQAGRLLAPAETRWGQHYDQAGFARKALRESRKAAAPEHKPIG